MSISSILTRGIGVFGSVNKVVTAGFTSGIDLGVTIDGAASYTLTEAYTSVMLYYDGSNYFTLDSIAQSHTHPFSDLTATPTTLAGYGITDGALSTHLHTGIYEPVFSKGTGFNLNLGTVAGTVSEGDHNHTLDSLSNLTITANSVGELLKWNGSAWINNTLAEAGISATGHTHTESDITDLQSYSLSTHVHTGVYEPADATILKDADIGVNVQAYDATLETGATQDQTAGEIEAIVNHDNLLGFVANEHIDWTADQGATNIHSGNYTDTDTTDHTALSNIGTNSHAVIDSHIADGTLHYTQAAISITESQISDLGSYSLTSHNHTLDGLSNTTITANSSGEILKWNGSAWVNNTLAEAGISTITDHGGLTGLADDDHTQYHNDTRALTWLGTRSTSDLSEGTNLYYTDARVTSFVDKAFVDALNVDADTLDTLNSTQFLRSDATDSFDRDNGYLRFINTDGGTADSATSTLGALEVYQPTSGADAFMNFHIGGDYATYFGLDGTTNDIFVGGWSNGAVKYTIWHEGNDGSGSGLDADTLDGVEGSGYSLSGHTHTLDGLSNTTITANSSGEILKWNGSAWINNTLAEAGIDKTYIDSLGVDATTLSGSSKDSLWLSPTSATVPVRSSSGQLGAPSLYISGTPITSVASHVLIESASTKYYQRQTIAQFLTNHNLVTSVVSQAEAEAGTSTTSRIWTAQRVAQAIAALETTYVNPVERDVFTATTASITANNWSVSSTHTLINVTNVESITVMAIRNSGTATEAVSWVAWDDTGYMSSNDQFSNIAMGSTAASGTIRLRLYNSDVTGTISYRCVVTGT